MTDRFLFVCYCETETIWAFIVFIRTAELLHAILGPVLETASAAARFMAFLRGDGGSLRASRCRFEGESWLVAKESEILTWPKANFL